MPISQTPMIESRGSNRSERRTARAGSPVPHMSRPGGREVGRTGFQPLEWGLDGSRGKGG
jgi:hypothetical protein